MSIWAVRVLRLSITGCLLSPVTVVSVFVALRGFLVDLVLIVLVGRLIAIILTGAHASIASETSIHTCCKTCTLPTVPSRSLPSGYWTYDRKVS